MWIEICKRVVGLCRVPHDLRRHVRFGHHRQEQVPVVEAGHELDRDLGSAAGSGDARVGHPIETLRVVPATVVRLEGRVNAEAGVELPE